jgi:aryl-alcohol dehydrogenase-like predicted oxidoreductase
MKIKQLGRTGLKVSEIYLGTMTFGFQCDEQTSFAILNRDWEGGINFIDTADVYPWVLSNPVITSAIVGASKPEQLNDTLPAAEVKLDSEEIEFMDKLWYNLPRTKNQEIALR